MSGLHSVHRLRVLVLVAGVVSAACNTPERPDSAAAENQAPGFVTVTSAAKPDLFAPDGSEIRVLAEGRRGSMCLCTLPAGGVSKAVVHQTVEELWYVVSGTGEVWRRCGENEETVEVRAGVSLNIPVGTQFQFRNTGGDSLQIIITTMPPWPGPAEAMPCEGPWQAHER